MKLLLNAKTLRERLWQEELENYIDEDYDDDYIDGDYENEELYIRE